MFRSMETCPTEIWHEIFAFVCTDSGLNGRSLSLVSKRFHDLSGPLKYQSIAITQWRQLIAFSQTFSQLPDIQKKIKYLFIHCPYPFLEVEDAPRLLQDINNFEDLYTDVEDSDMDYTSSESDSDLDMEFEGSMKSDEEQELFEDSDYLLTIRSGAIRNGILPPQLNDTPCRDDHSEDLDYEIQAVFDKATHALHAILKETSLTLNILTLYWTSFRPLQIPTILSGQVLPFLDELHLYRCSVVGDDVYKKIYPSTTPLLPRLRFLIVSGDGYSGPLEREIAIIAPNLTHLRFTPTNFDNNIQYDTMDWYRWIDGSLSDDAIVEMSSKHASEQLQALLNGRRFDASEFSSPMMPNIGVWPEHWQMVWSSRVAGLPDVWSVC